MDDGILSLKWNNHNSTFIHTLSTLHKMEMYSDVTLACEGKYFAVHKLVLSICSEYFEEILSKTKCQHPVVVLKDIKHNDLEALLNYMYAGEANVAQSELANLIKAAECLRIKGLAVPDESPPVREKRRHIESDSSHNKKRRNDDISSSNNQIYKDLDTSENSILSENSKNKRVQENSEQSEKENERLTSNPIQDRENHKKIPEIVLEGQPIEVKQEVTEVTEPKIEEHDDSHPHLDDSNIDISYTMHVGDEENSESERHAQDSQTTHILQDLMSHSVPGPSGVQGHEPISNWESNSNNLSGYSVESYSSDEGRNQQMDASVSGGAGALTPQQQQQQQPPQTVFECPYCPRAFLYRSDLTRHLRSHTGEKPFTCPFCSYRGTQKTHLHEHIKRKHKAILPDYHDPTGVPSVCAGTSTILHLPFMRDDLPPRPASPFSPPPDHGQTARHSPASSDHQVS